MPFLRSLLITLTTMCALHTPASGAPAASAAEAILSSVTGMVSSRSESRQTNRVVGRGVTHLNDFQATGPLNFNVLKIDLADPELTVIVEPGKDQLYAGERVPDTAERESRPGHSVIGGINADFWSMTPRPYIPMGMLVANGMLCRAPGNRSVFAVTEDEKVYFDPLTLKTTLSAGGKSLQIERINDLGATRSVTLFTPPVGDELPPSRMSRIVLELETAEFLPNKPATAKMLRVAKPADTVAMSAKTVVVAAPDSEIKKLSLKPGAKVTLNARVPEIDGVIAFCCGAAPRIVRDGRVSVETRAERLSATFAAARHPRTAAGVSADGRTLYLVTVDGRRPLISVGQSLEELAHYMISLGCSDAVNLDGGGSSTMVVRGEVVNHPSDAGGPRRVVNSLLVVNRRPPGPLAQIVVEPGDSPLVVPTGSRVELGVKGYDFDFTPLSLEDAPLRWSADRVGRVEPREEAGALLITSSEPASGVIRVESGSVKSEIPAHVVAVEQLSVSPDVVLLTSGETVPLRVEASGGGRRIPLLPEMLTVSASDQSLSASAQALTGMEPGQGEVQVRVGGASARVRYFVDRFHITDIENFDVLESSAKPGGSNFEPAQTRLTQRTDGCKEGSGCLAVEYTMKPDGGRSEITIPVTGTIETEPMKVGLWVFGDGSEAWVRGELVDAAGTRFTVDFTEETKGVVWDDEWRRVTVPVSSFVGRRVRAGARPRFPAQFRSLSISQEQEALKSSGRLVFDGLQAIYPPVGAGSQ